MKKKEIKCFVAGVCLCVSYFLATSVAYAQCPTDLNDLADGGTFSGDCDFDINTGTSPTLNITGTVTWTSGTLTLDNTGGGKQHLIITGDFDLQGGILDLPNGDLLVDRGSLTTVSGTAVIVDGDGRDFVVNDGVLNAAGSLTVDDIVEFKNGSDVDLSGLVNVGKDLLINGSGTTLDLGSGAELNVVSDVQIESGAIGFFGNDSELYLGNHLIIEDASLTIEGKIENTGSASNDLQVLGSATVVVNDGADVSGVRNVNIDGSANLDINGGSISITGKVNGTSPTDASELPSQINLDGGSFDVGGVPLPVILTSFVASYDRLAERCLLKWETAMEINNYGFYIEKSSDAYDFDEIAFVPGAGTTGEPHQYEYQYKYTGLQLYFRLRQVDYNGSVEYSPIVMIRSVDDELTSMLVYPNPTTGEIYFSDISALDMEAMIFDLSGVGVCQSKDSSDEVSNQLSQCFEKQATGKYVLQFETESGKKSVVVVKQ